LLARQPDSWWPSSFGTARFRDRLASSVRDPNRILHRRRSSARSGDRRTHSIAAAANRGNLSERRPCRISSDAVTRAIAGLGRFRYDGRVAGGLPDRERRRNTRRNRCSMPRAAVCEVRRDGLRRGVRHSTWSTHIYRRVTSADSLGTPAKRLRANSGYAKKSGAYIFSRAARSISSVTWRLPVCCISP
jgi:hypothetical protein